MRVYDIGRAAAAREAAADDEPGSEVAFLHGHSGAVFGVDFSHDRQLLFSASADGTVRLWHMELEACLNSYRHASSHSHSETSFCPIMAVGSV